MEIANNHKANVYSVLLAEQCAKSIKRIVFS